VPDGRADETNVRVARPSPPPPRLEQQESPTNPPVGKDEFGNRYYENYNAREEVPGRQRWVDYAQDDFNASQVSRGWYSWLSNIRQLPPTEDPVFQASKQPWQVPYTENL
jgi:NADH:ubiquinone oxidoreductase subunit